MHNEAFRWTPFILFALVNSFTPGPNVILLASSGGLWGFKRTLPHLLGICFGFPIMLLLVLYGLDQIFRSFPWLFNILTIASLAYILWLAIRVFKMGLGAALKINSRARPMSFMEGASFQWVNGKAWQIALMTATLYPTGDVGTRLSMIFLLGFITFVAGMMWIELGSRLAGSLAHPIVRKAYYSFLAIALLLSTWPIGIHQLLSGASH